MKRFLHTACLLFLIVSIGCASAPVAAITSEFADTPAPIKAKGDDDPVELPPNTFGNVDASTLTDKVIFGYQGWFGCPGDGSRVNSWFHWDHESVDLKHVSVDFWPDTAEFSDAEKFATGLKDTRGNTLYAYSAYNETTVKRHFYWIAKNGVDGVELQRFANELNDPRYKDFRDRVLDNVISGAEADGRVFYIRYDWLASDTMATIKTDWKNLVNSGVTDNPQYLHHNGLPIVGLFGIGYEFEDYSIEEMESLIAFFQDNPEEKYRAVVKGGVPFEWRQIHFENDGNSPYQGIMQSLDIISPWAVGVYGSGGQAYERHQQVSADDMKLAQQWGADYMPVIFPGFSWKNSKPGFPLNQIPRRGGQFMWQQAYSLLDLGVNMIYVAMFDEFDEGTNIHPAIEQTADLPAGEVMVPLHADGYEVPSDWYLTLSGSIADVVHGEKPLSVDFPLQRALNFLTVGGWDANRNAVGEWERIDEVDGSYQTLSVTEISDNTYKIESSDEKAPPCDNKEIVVEGTGEVLGNLIIIPKYSARCADAPRATPWVFYNVLTFDMASDTVTDVWDAVWERKN